MPFADRAQQQNLSTDADQVELDAIKYGSATVDSGLFDEHIASANDDFQEDDFEDNWFQRDVANDSAAGGVFSELERRRLTLGSAYPFEIDGNALTYKPEVDSITYRFCLAVSLQRNITSKPYTKMPRTFEQLSRLYSQFHFGPYAKSLHTGWPRVVGQPKAFIGMANLLHQETGEWWWQPDQGLEDTDANPIKDCGIDFVTWLEFPDESQGKLFLTGQCACGNNWTDKFYDVEKRKYERWFGPVSWMEKPIKAFCVPFALVPDYIRDATEQAGLVYERIRLALFAREHEIHLPADLIADMQECISMSISGD